MRAKQVSNFISLIVLSLGVLAHPIPTVKTHLPNTCSWNKNWEQYLDSNKNNSFLVLGLTNQRLCLF